MDLRDRDRSQRFGRLRMGADIDPIERPGVT
jgi:hypothetical protein